MKGTIQKHGVGKRIHIYVKGEDAYEMYKYVGKEVKLLVILGDSL